MQKTHISMYAQKILKTWSYLPSLYIFRGETWIQARAAGGHIAKKVGSIWTVVGFEYLEKPVCKEYMSIAHSTFQAQLVCN